IEGRPVIDLDQHTTDLAERRHGGAPGFKLARMQIDPTSFGQSVTCMLAVQTGRGLPECLVSDGGSARRCIGETPIARERWICDPLPPPLAPAKAFSRSGRGRIFSLYSRVMREGLSTGHGARWLGSGLSEIGRAHV